MLYSSEIQPGALTLLDDSHGRFSDRPRQASCVRCGVSADASWRTTEAALWQCSTQLGRGKKKPCDKRLIVVFSLLESCWLMLSQLQYTNVYYNSHHQVQFRYLKNIANISKLKQTLIMSAIIEVSNSCQICQESSHIWIDGLYRNLYQPFYSILQ